jgi:protoporphyrinogen oxidase
MIDSRPTVAVIGGGFTGLVAALRLAQTGHGVELLEAGETLGGLASGFEFHGTSIERAYHHLFRTDADMLALVHELGLEDLLEWYRSSIAAYWDGRLWPFMTPRDLLHFAPLSFANRVRLGLVALYLRERRDWRPFTRQTALAWMESYSGSEATRVVWEPLLRGKFHGFADSVSMAWLWSRLHARSNSRAPGHQVERLGYFNGGFDVVVRALRTRLEAAEVAIHTRAAVGAITGGEKPTLTIGAETRTFSAVVATLPSHVFAKLIAADPHVSGGYLRQLESVQYLGAVCIVFSTLQDLGNYYWVNVNEPGAPFVVFINHTKLVDRARYEGHSIYYLGAYLPHDHVSFSQSNAELENSWLAYVAKIYPEFDRGSVVECHVNRFRNAQHVVTCDSDKRIPSHATPAPNVYLANFSQIFPEDRGTSYAVRDGKRIAALVAESWASVQAKSATASP